jgi:hypothetical protein
MADSIIRAPSMRRPGERSKPMAAAVWLNASIQRHANGGTSSPKSCCSMRTMTICECSCRSGLLESEPATRR